MKNNENVDGEHAYNVAYIWCSIDPPELCWDAMPGLIANHHQTITNDDVILMIKKYSSRNKI